jgi:TolB-like protein/class 3 adenylate cyclase
MTRNTKVLLVMDVVESVRIMEQDQDGFVRRWQQLVEEAEQKVLPLHGGRIVKSLGDGLMLEFASAQGCVKAAFALHSFTRQANRDVRPEHQIHLRMGGHLASFVTDHHDIYGTDVNLTSRVSTLAGPGEMVVSSDLRDELAAGLDADVEDLGECHLKHVENPVRAYRVGPVGHDPVIPASATLPPDFRPTVAVIPFEARSNEPQHFVIGELIADGVIAQLSRSPDIRVISRLSTTAFRGRASAMPDVESRLGASFVLSGSYLASGSKILIIAELADARTAEIVWAERVSGATDDLLQAQSELLNSLAAATSRALIDAEVQQSLVQPMPRLDSSALLLGGIALMHRSSIREFERSREILSTLVERHSRVATARAWLAKWHLLRIVRGLSEDPHREARIALELTQRALDSEPDHALTLSIEGLAYSQVLGEFDLANNRLTSAIASNPNESMAWLFKSVLSTMWGSAPDSVSESLFASALSPIDPLKYFFELITASAFLTNNEHSLAIKHANMSIRANRHHAPTYRVLLTAQVESGRMDEARYSLHELLREQPGMTVSSYLSIGSTNSVTRRRCAEALRLLGLPEH